ncbi:hypothetical protein FO519_005300, partial [Halicephalobus sp. NKZ332]
AIKIDDFDTGSAVYNATTEFVEFGLEYGESMDLLPGVKNGNEITAKSIKSSISSTISHAKNIFSYIVSGFKWFLMTTKTFWFVVIYSVIGALLFMYIETPGDVESRIEQRQYHLMARDVLAFNIRQIHDSKRLDAEYEIKQAIIQFEENLGISMPSEETAWTFWMSILYAGTIYTTIGYGNIACTTSTGRFVTILYALVGIPMMIVVLDQLGDFLLRIVKKGASIMEDLVLFIGVKTRLMRVKSEKSLSRYVKVSKNMAFFGLSSSVPSKSVSFGSSEIKKKPQSEKGSEKSSDVNIDMKTESSDSDDDWKRDPPIFSAVFVTISWILASAGVFCLWEDWTYSTSIYFFFISTSTIGFGDVSPTHPEYMMATFGVVIVGLSLVSVCINVVQEWLQQWYMSILQKMLQQYIEAQEQGDENAAKGFMTGFNQGQMKYFMPLISKNSGQKAMEQLKKEAKEKGIELPPALTELNPETGKPAFLNATEKQIDQIIEKAQNEGKLTPSFTRPMTTTVSIQASFSGDKEIAQTQTELGWDFFELRFEKSTQFEPLLAGKIGVEVETEAKPKMTTTAIQPEVSSIFQFHLDTFKYDDDELEEKLENIILAKREAQPGEEGFGDETAEIEQIGMLRFLKNTGTQVMVNAVESGNQTEEKKSEDFGQQMNPELEEFGGQTEEKKIRSMKSQTQLTTIQKQSSTAGPKKIVLTPEEKTSLKTRLLELRQEVVKKLREEADSEIDSSTSTLPGPRQFAVPSRLDIAQRQEEKVRDEPGFGIVETVEKRISEGKFTYEPKDEKSVYELEAEAEDISEEMGIKLISTPPGMESDKEKEAFAVIRPRSTQEITSGESTPRRRPRPLFESLSDENLRSPTAIVELSQSQPILTVSREGYEEITLNVELIRRSISSFDSSSQARSVAGSVTQWPGPPPLLHPEIYIHPGIQVSSDHGSHPELHVHPELLLSREITSTSTPSPIPEIPKSELISSENLPMEELESMIDYEDLFKELDEKEDEEDLEFFFLNQMGIQTEMSYFERTTKGVGTDPEKFTHGVQTELTALDSERGPRAIVESLLPEQTTISIQTTPMVTTESVQVGVEKEDKCVGGKVDYESTEVQTIEKETKDASSEATITKHRISVQTEVPAVIEEGTQVETEKKTQYTETESSISETAVGFDVETALKYVQTEQKEVSDSEIQVNPRTSDSSTETEVLYVSTATEAEQIKTKDKDSQTESIRVSSAVSSEDQFKNEKTAIQPEISSLYKPKDPSEMETELTYMVDSSTEQDYDLVMQHATTQHTVSMGNFSQQYFPDTSHASSQAVVKTKESPSIVYSNTSMQTESEDSGDAPVLLEANIVSVNSSLSSSAIYGDEEGSSELPKRELSIEATFPASFFVESITLTSDVETQVDFIHSETGTQIQAGDFSSEAGIQAEISTMDRQTSLDSDDLEPLESGFSFKAPGGGCLWSDFDVLGITETEGPGEYYEEEEIEAGEAAIEAGQDVPSPSVSLAVPEERPVQDPDDAQFIKPFELDQKRRERMMDIGIQTGVLARVQHIYSKKGGVGQDDTSGDIKRVTLRKFGSTSTLDPQSQLTATSGSTLSLQELFQMEPGSSVESLPGPSSISPKDTEPQLDAREESKMIALHEIMTILGRRRLYPSDVARDVDFLVFHAELNKFSVLDDPKWQLYSINSKYAYFVEMPFGVSEYSFKFCDSISEAQFGEAQRLARVSWERFIQKCDKNWQFKGGIGKVIALTTMLNSGSSSLCHLIQQVAEESPNPNSIMIFSKPDAFTQLSSYCESYEEFGVQKCRMMLLVLLRYFCKDQTKNQTYILRLRPSCIRLVQHFHSVAPHVMNVFTARDQLEHSISLFINPKTEAESDYSKLSIVLRNTCRIFSNIPTVCLGENYSVNAIRPKSMIELAVALICSSVINYKKQKKYYITPVIYYENLISETRENLKSLFDLCGLTDLRISNSLVEAAKGLGEKESGYIKELSNEEKPVIEQTTQLLEFYSD